MCEWMDPTHQSYEKECLELSYKLGVVRMQVVPEGTEPFPSLGVNTQKHQFPPQGKVFFLVLCCLPRWQTGFILGRQACNFVTLECKT